MRAFVAISILLAASSAGAQGLRGSVTAGFGVGRDLAGGELELGSGQWTVSLGYGYEASNFSPRTLAFGARWSVQSDGSGFAIALHGLAARYGDDGGVKESITIISAAAHWRWKWSWFLIDVGAGPALSFDSLRLPSEDYGADNNRLGRSTSFGVSFGTTAGTFPFDLELGIGIPF